MRRIQFSNAPRTASAFAFTPGLFLLAAGLLVLLAPKVVAFLLASFLVYAGALVLFLGWKFLKFRRKIEELLARGLPRVEIRTEDFEPSSRPDIVIEQDERGTYGGMSKKPYLH